MTQKTFTDLWVVRWRETERGMFWIDGEEKWWKIRYMCHTHRSSTLSSPICKLNMWTRETERVCQKFNGISWSSRSIDLYRFTICLIFENENVFIWHNAVETRQSIDYCRHIWRPHTTNVQHDFSRAAWNFCYRKSNHASDNFCLV